jgi:hypothetical protein
MADLSELQKGRRFRYLAAPPGWGGTKVELRYPNPDVNDDVMVLSKDGNYRLVNYVDLVPVHELDQQLPLGVVAYTVYREDGSWSTYDNLRHAEIEAEKTAGRLLTMGPTAWTNPPLPEDP